MKSVMERFYENYNWLERHPIFNGYFNQSLDVEVVKVCPDTKSIEDDKSKNTKVQVWLECGPVVMKPSGRVDYYEHDLDLDCGGDTYEKAINRLAELVRHKYGNYKV